MEIRILIISVLSILISCTNSKIKQEADNSPLLEEVNNADMPPFAETKNNAVDSVSKDTVSFEVQISKDSKLELQKFRMYYKSVVQPVTFSENTPIYNTPDTTSQIIESLLFNTPIIPVQNSEITDWVQIVNENDTSYLKSNTIAWYSFPAVNDRPFIYFITEKNESATIHKYHIKENRFVSVFELPNFLIDDADYINASNWKNVDLLVSLNYNGNCCGCPETQRYLVDANGEFKILFKTAQYIDDGEDDAGSVSHVQFPLNPETMDIIYTKSDYGYGGDPVNIKKRFRWNGDKLIEQVE